MKLGLGKIKEALRSGTAKDTGEGKKEQIGGRRQADKEETQKMVNSEKDSGSLEEVKMKLKRTEQEPRKWIVVSSRPHQSRKDRPYLLSRFRLGHFPNASGKRRAPPLYKRPDL